VNEEREHIDALLEIMQEHDLDALTVRTPEVTYELVRRETVGSAIPAMAPVDPAQPGASRTGEVAGENAKKVTAPIIGVFYRSSAPGTEPFVEVGDRVAVGQVLCILEAMKLMNEITSDDAGVVTRILPENGQLVALGEEMFWIEP
jgi:acetyl-CoA carboxylase biotin carboxyl carrier protein